MVLGLMVILYGGIGSSRTFPKISYLSGHKFSGSPFSMTPHKPQILKNQVLVF